MRLAIYEKDPMISRVSRRGQARSARGGEREQAADWEGQGRGSSFTARPELEPPIQSQSALL